MWMRGRLFDCPVCPLYLYFAFALVLITEIPTYIFYNSKNLVRNEPLIDCIGDFYKHIDASYICYTLVY